MERSTMKEWTLKFSPNFIWNSIHTLMTYEIAFHSVAESNLFYWHYISALKRLTPKGAKSGFLLWTSIMCMVKICILYPKYVQEANETMLTFITLYTVQCTVWNHSMESVVCRHVHELAQGACSSQIFLNRHFFQLVWCSLLFLSQRASNWLKERRTTGYSKKAGRSQFPVSRTCLITALKCNK